MLIAIVIVTTIIIINIIVVIVVWHVLVLLGLLPGEGVSDTLCALLVGMGSYWVGIGSHVCRVWVRIQRWAWASVVIIVCGNLMRIMMMVIAIIAITCIKKPVAEQKQCLRQCLFF